MQSQPFINPEIPSGTANPAWPPLRSDLQFHRAQDNATDSSPHNCWMLYDPLRGQYLELGELEILVLHHWPLGSPQKIADTIARQQGCAVDPEQVKAAAQFIRDNELTQTDSQQIAQKLAAVTPQQKRLTQLQKTLFWRRPLFVPDLSSRLLQPLARCTRHGWFYAVLLCSAIFAGISINQHWPEFLAYFDASWNAAGAALFFACYLVLSLFHELGHASVARLYGVRANSVGFGLIAFMPIMFSEITDAWRLPRRARLHISAAGVAFEFTLGSIAALAWCLMDDGPLRALMFYLFTTSLISTLLINANPLMKFDGYYLLSDFTGEKNLHQTATNTLRHWIWLKLLRSRPPASDRRHKLLTLFGFASLVYRLSVFTLISYAAYQMLFKAAGILVLILCVGLLLILPAVREILGFLSFFKEQRNLAMAKSASSQNADSDEGRWQSAIQILRMLNPRILFCSAFFLALLLVPLPWPVQLPAATYFSQQQKVVAPANATLESLELQAGSSVQAGNLIASLHDSELDYRIARTQAELQLLRRRQSSDGFAESLDALDGVYLQDLLSKQQLLRKLETEKQQLTIVAKVSGTVDWVLPGVHTGQYLELNQPILTIADRHTLSGRAYGQSAQVSRLVPPEKNHSLSGRLFLAGQWRALPVAVNAVEQIASRRIQDPALASDFDGPLQTLPDDRERSAEALHLVSFSIPADTALTPASAQRTGYLVIFGTPTSLLSLIADRIAGVVIRESGV
ncbi:hypothetical protein [Microbulbifer aggregans]|uniref:hypothetical protein n=1 Tax=Microbulbifer aggregans TaxID=1769779 RepID=UPI001CFD5056|nr:hypothetical protein [Microbulbifer aggregans]